MWNQGDDRVVDAPVNAEKRGWMVVHDRIRYFDVEERDDLVRFHLQKKTA
jgi:hypothetical protein